MTIEEPWYIGSWMEVVERPETVDEVVEQNDEYAGVALLALVLNHPESKVVLPRIKQALVSPRSSDPGQRSAMRATTPGCMRRSITTW